MPVCGLVGLCFQVLSSREILGRGTKDVHLAPFQRAIYVATPRESVGLAMAAL